MWSSFPDAMIALPTHPPCQAHFQMRHVAAHISFKAELIPPCIHITDPDSPADAVASIIVKGDPVRKCRVETETIVFPSSSFLLLFHIVICATVVIVLRRFMPGSPYMNHLPPLASKHPPPIAKPDPTPTSTSRSALTPPTLSTTPTLSCPPHLPPHHPHQTPFHAPMVLPTCHHWSEQGKLSGIIYTEGPRDAIETFVRNFKGIWWLALRVRVFRVQLGIRVRVVNGGWK